MSARQAAQPTHRSPRGQDARRDQRTRKPTLAEILADTSTAPWTLGAFTAYAAQNLCLENIDFTMDAKQYEKLWQDVLEQSPDLVESPDSAKKEKLKQEWKRIMRVYMTPNGPREINLPGDVRSALLSIPESSIPPSPTVLKPALKKIYELMEESIYFPFLTDVQANNPSRTSAEYPERHTSSHRHSATAALLRPTISHGSGVNENSSSHSRPVVQAHNSLPLPPLGRPASHPISSQSSSKPSRRKSGSISAPVAGGTSAITEEPSSMSSALHEGTSTSTTPPGSESGSRRNNRQRSPSENPWRKIGSRLGFRKRSGSGLKEQSDKLALERGRSPGPVFEDD